MLPIMRLVRNVNTYTVLLCTSKHVLFGQHVSRICGGHLCRKLKQDPWGTHSGILRVLWNGWGICFSALLFGSAFEQIYVPEDAHVSLPGDHNAAVID